MTVTVNTGLGRMAQAALAATTLTPVLVVWGAARYLNAPPETGLALIAAALLAAVCLSILGLAHRRLQTDPLPVVKARRLDKDALAFLVTYALPMITSSGKDTNLPALVVFMAIVGVVLVQLQVLYVNPLLGILGYHFYEVENADGDVALVLSRSVQAPRTGAIGQRLAPGLWIVAGDD